MGVFTRTKTADPPEGPAQDAGKKIILNFGGRASTAVLAMAAATLEAGGYTEPPPREPQVGDMMPDGTRFAGISPDTGKPLFTTPADAPLTMTFNEAKEYASKLDAPDHRPWRLPSQTELNLLFKNRAAIGGFEATSWYWSSSKHYSLYAYGQSFGNGDRDFNNVDSRLSVRCVR